MITVQGARDRTHARFVNISPARLDAAMAMIADIEDAYTTAVETAARSTVSVSTSVGPFGGPWGPYPRRGQGSGVVLDGQGHVLTNHHVVAGAERVIVTTPDGRVLSGTVAGSDEDSDVAVIHVDPEGLRPAAFGDSEKLRVGQPVLAIGNPLGLAGGPTVTSGVVSSLRRNVQLHRTNGLRVIQTDAAVNPGNSGGPLVDLQGRVVAINTVTIPYAEGIGFSIPINDALLVAKDLLAHGRVQRPWLGIVGYDVDRRVAHYYGLAARSGIFVVEVTEKSPAASAGIKAGDVLVALGDRQVDSLADLVEALKDRKIGDATEAEVDRSGQRARIRLTLGPRPF